MKFTFHDEKEPKQKFAWFPVCINEEKRIWIWLERYTEKVVERYGIGGVLYYRESKDASGESTGMVG